MGFARIKEILDQAIVAWRNAPGRTGPPNLSGHGAMFSWSTKPALLEAVSHGRRLIQPEVIGNGKGNQANLIIDLRTGFAGPRSRMPEGGPYIPDPQIQEIDDWIDASSPD